MPTQQQIDLLLIDEEIARRKAVRDFGTFCKLAWHIVEPTQPYVHGWHMDAIGIHLDACLDGRIRNLLINMPPRCSKSTLISVMFPAWVWLRYPGKKFLFSSYASSLSVRDSIKCRRLIESDWYRSFFKPSWQMNSDQNTQSEFSNTMQGHRIATSVDGAATGKGGDIIVCDDPHKASDVYGAARENAINWWDEEMSTRSINPKTVVRIIVMQRLHPMDLSGHVLAQGGYTHLVLPMEYDGQKEPTSIGWQDPREEYGELLSPDRFGPNEIADLKIRLGSRGYAGQMQQRPASVEGGIIKRAWFKYYRELPWNVSAHVMAGDYATSEKTTADFTVLGAASRQGLNNVYLVDWFRKRMEFPEAVRETERFIKDNPRCLKRKLEKKSNGVAVIQTLKAKLPGIIEYEPKSDKLSRLNAVAPFVEAGNVYLPEGAPWVGPFLDEVCSFAGEGSGHDDQVDVLVMLLDEFANSGIPTMPIGVSAAGAGRGY